MPWELRSCDNMDPAACLGSLAGRRRSPPFPGAGLQMPHGTNMQRGSVGSDRLLLASSARPWDS